MGFGGQRHNKKPVKMIYNIMDKSVLTYGAETWSVYGDDRRRINGTEMAGLTLILLTWTIWRAPTNARKWRMGFNSAFKGLRRSARISKLERKTN